MKFDESSPLVTTDWLAAHLGDPDIRIVDARWRARFEQGRGISADDYEGYLESHIPGAVFVGMKDELADAEHPVPDMLAPPAQFAEVISRLGIGESTLVIAYDNMGFPLGAARLWWALSYYGHRHVRVLDGGLREWVRERRPLSQEVPDIEPAVFEPKPNPDWIASKQDVVAALDRDDTVIIDCLTPELYEGRGERHQWGQRKGHIPGAVNVPFRANIDPALTTTAATDRERLLASDRSFAFSEPEALAALYGAAGVTSKHEVITYCGLGYAASCGLLALKILGQKQVRLYDGSWEEWSADPDLPAEVSPQAVPPAVFRIVFENLIAGGFVHDPYRRLWSHA